MLKEVFLDVQECVRMTCVLCVFFLCPCPRVRQQGIDGHGDARGSAGKCYCVSECIDYWPRCYVLCWT